MAYEFKRLSDVTLLDSVPNNATVLAEVDGAIRRVPGNGLGGGNSAGGYTVDYPETTYTFDGDLTGKESFQIEIEGIQIHFVRLGDCVDDDSRFIGQRLTAQMKDTGAISSATSGYSYDEDRGVYAYTNTTDNTDYLAVGAAVRVRWDGTLYECEVQDGGAAFGEGAFAIGNGSGFGLSGSDEPFLLVFSGSGSAYYALNDSAAGVNHDLTVYVTTEQTLEITADYIMDLGALLEGLYPVGQVGLVGEMMVFNIRADTEMGIFQLAMGGGEQVAPLQTVRQGLYAVYTEQPESDSDITDPVTTTVCLSSVGVAAGTNTVELPEALTEVKTNRLGGYWCKGVSLAWDGNTEGVEQLSSNLPMYRISDAPIPATLPVSALLVTETTAEDGTVTTEMKQISAEGLTYAGDSSNAIPVFQLDADAAVISVYEDFLLNGVTVRKGTYAGCVDTEADGTKTHTYVYMVTVESGWARWPEQLGGGSSVEIKDASETEAGVMKLYTALGSNTDGAVTQKAVNEEISSVQDKIAALDDAALVKTKTFAPINTSTYGAAVFYHDGRYIVALYDRICTSLDLMAWNITDTSAGGIRGNYGSNYGNLVAYGAGKYVAIYSGTNKKTPMYSSDGIEWVYNDKLDSSLPANQQSIIFGGDRFVLLPQNGADAAYSDDGVTWTKTTLPDSLTWYGAAYGDGKFVMLSYSSASDDRVAVYSTDGVAWNLATMPSNDAYSLLAFGNGKFVAASPENGESVSDWCKIACSTDGVTWEAVGTVNTGGGGNTTLFFDGSRFILCSNSAFVQSVDGVNWSEYQGYKGDFKIGTGEDSLRPSCFVNGEYVANRYGGSTGNIYVSEDMVNWKKGRYGFQNAEGSDITHNVQSALGMGDDYVILASSTEGSSKKFKVTVDDSGTLTATEITS